MNLDDLVALARDIHATAYSKGWWDGKREAPELIALMHSELSEALEEYRDGKPLFYLKDGKPEGQLAELADCVIRILDYVEYLDESWQFIDALTAKVAYNKTRPHRHGGKKA